MLLPLYTQSSEDSLDDYGDDATWGIEAEQRWAEKTGFARFAAFGGGKRRTWLEGETASYAGQNALLVV